MEHTKRNHEDFMQIAIQLSRQAVENGSHPFGALLVKDGEIILEIENSVDSDHDCTQHAETKLVSQATKLYEGEFLSQCTLYSSTEPCPMCAGAIFWSGIRTLVYGCSAKTLTKYIGPSFFKCSTTDILTEASGIQIIGPTLEREAEKIHQLFSKDNEYKERWF
jgi:tRNA(Arg) A34 adenosine deaminase TadA